VVSRRLLALASAPAHSVAALVVEQASRWRAAKMRGALIRGEAAIFVPGDLRSGRRSLDAAIREVTDIDDIAVVRVRADGLVWWRGWASGTVGRS
jgi:hypothetical protein